MKKRIIQTLALLILAGGIFIGGYHMQFRETSPVQIISIACHDATWKKIDRNLDLSYFREMDDYKTFTQIKEEIGLPNGWMDASDYTSIIYPYYQVDDGRFAVLIFIPDETGMYERIGKVYVCDKIKVLKKIYYAEPEETAESEKAEEPEKSEEAETQKLIATPKKSKTVIEPKNTEIISAYAKAYYDFLSDYINKHPRKISGDNGTRFLLSYVDEDYVPELLVLNRTRRRTDADVYTYRDKQVEYVGKYENADSGEDINPEELILYTDGVLLQKETVKDEIINFDTMLNDGLNYPTAKNLILQNADVYRAYAEYLDEEYGKKEERYYYYLMYLDPDDIPELAVMSYAESGIYLYRYTDAGVICLNEICLNGKAICSPAAIANIVYEEKSGIILSEDSYLKYELCNFYKLDKNLLNVWKTYYANTFSKSPETGERMWKYYIPESDEPVSYEQYYDSYHQIAESLDLKYVDISDGVKIREENNIESFQGEIRKNIIRPVCIKEEVLRDKILARTDYDEKDIVFSRCLSADENNYKYPDGGLFLFLGTKTETEYGGTVYDGEMWFADMDSCKLLKAGSFSLIDGYLPNGDYYYINTADENPVSYIWRMNRFSDGDSGTESELLNTNLSGEGRIGALGSENEDMEYIPLHREDGVDTYVYGSDEKSLFRLPYGPDYWSVISDELAHMADENYAVAYTKFLQRAKFDKSMKACMIWLDDDDIPELVLFKDESVKSKLDGGIIYTYDEKTDEVVCLNESLNLGETNDGFGRYGFMNYAEKDGLVWNEWEGADSYYWQVYRQNGPKIELVHSFGYHNKYNEETEKMEFYDFKIDGKEVSQKEYEKVRDQWYVEFYYAKNKNVRIVGYDDGTEYGNFATIKPFDRIRNATYYEEIIDDTIKDLLLRSESYLKGEILIYSGYLEDEILYSKYMGMEQREFVFCGREKKTKDGKTVYEGEVWYADPDECLCLAEGLFTEIDGYISSSRPYYVETADENPLTLVWEIKHGSPIKTVAAGDS